MIRFALWAHASLLHFMVTGAAAVAVGFLALLGALFSARCAWRRRRAALGILRRGLGLQPRSAPVREVFGPVGKFGAYQKPLPQRIPGRPDASGRPFAPTEEQIQAQAELFVELATGECLRAGWRHHNLLMLDSLAVDHPMRERPRSTGSESDD